jgi:hypothetical protein
MEEDKGKGGLTYILQKQVFVDNIYNDTDIGFHPKLQFLCGGNVTGCNKIIRVVIDAWTIKMLVSSRSKVICFYFILQTCVFSTSSMPQDEQRTPDPEKSSFVSAICECL